MKKAIIILSLLIGVIFIAGCINRNAPTSFSGDLSFELKIHDSLPKNLTLQDDGTLTFTEGENTNSVKLSPEEVDSLKQYILDNNFFSMKEKYEGGGCCDFIAHTITVSIGDKKHSVYCYNDCPEEFNNIKEKIKSLWPDKIQYMGWA